MAWELTGEVEPFAARAEPVLSPDPIEQTLALTTLASLRANRPFGTGSPVFARLEEEGETRGVALMTPPYELQLALVPHESIAGLVAALRDGGAEVPGVHGDPGTTAAFSAAWTAGTELTATPSLEMRLFALRELLPPDPAPAGRVRLASPEDTELTVAWIRAFFAESPLPPGNAAGLVAERVADERLWLWADEAGTPVSLCAVTATVAGTARIAPVYTPPAHRRHGYGAAVTAAATAAALAGDAERVVLFTDLENRTANAMYPRIGYTPVSDRRVVRFA